MRKTNYEITKKIVIALADGRKSVTELSIIVSASRPTIYEHLAWLIREGLVGADKKYSLLTSLETALAIVNEQIRKENNNKKPATARPTRLRYLGKRMEILLIVPRELCPFCKKSSIEQTTNRNNYCRVCGTEIQKWAHTLCV